MGVSVLVLERQPGPPTALRGETIQPNGQQILGRLGLLSALTPEVVESVQRFHFIRIGGERLCTMDYGMLPEPNNRALVALSSAVHHQILSRLSAQAGAQLWYGAEFQGILQNNGRVVGVVVRQAGLQSSTEIQADLVVGADGAASLVRRALGIQAEVHRYRHGYLIALLPRPEGMRGEARYYVGRGELLGLFPAPGDRVVALSMVETDAVDAPGSRGLSALKSRVAVLHGLAAEQTFFWNAADAVRCFLRDRVFRGLDRNARLRYKSLTATAGLRTTPPLTWMDKLMAAGFLPDPRADQVPA